MISNEELLAANKKLRKFAEDTIPGFEIRTKKESKLMKVISWVLFFMDFMNFTTTIGTTVYVDNAKDFGNTITNPSKLIHDYVLLRHEIRHIQDQENLKKKYGAVFGSLLYGFKYLFPQCLAPLAFLGLLWGPLWLLGALVAPWPSPGRTWIETRGYDESAKAAIDLGLTPGPEWIESKVRSLTKKSYYWSTWRGEPLRKHFKETIREYTKLREENKA